jgi:hypothetical protein
MTTPDRAAEARAERLTCELKLQTEQNHRLQGCERAAAELPVPPVPVPVVGKTVWGSRDSCERRLASRQEPPRAGIARIATWNVRWFPDGAQDVNDTTRRTDVAWLAVLAIIALPMYTEHVRKGKRSEAMQALGDLQLRQERYRADNPSYANALGLLGVNTTTYNAAMRYYNISILAGTATER